MFVNSVKAENDVPVCHYEGNGTYHLIHIAAAAAFNGHMGESHQDGLDIIPPFEFRGSTYAQNWDDSGRALFEQFCTETPTNTPMPSDTPTMTATASEVPTESPSTTPTQDVSASPTITSTAIPTEINTPVDNLTPTPFETVAAKQLPNSGIGPENSETDYVSLFIGFFAALILIVIGVWVYVWFMSKE